MNRLLIIAGSGRSLAYSARRAGFTPIVIDGFADADLRAIAQVHPCPIDDFSPQALQAARSLPAMTWVYGGGVENDPKFVHDVSVHHRLCGIEPAVLREVRNPALVQLMLAEHAIAFPRSITSDELATMTNSDSRWIAKPIHSAGGVDVREVKPGEKVPGDRYQIQEYLAGTRVGGLYLGSGAKVDLVGITRPTSWIERSISPFLYRGTVGPVQPEPNVASEIQRAGEVIGQGFRLRGLFGIDFIVERGRPHVIEINPRPTASVEILELATGCSLLARHLSEFGVNAPEAIQSGPARGQAQKVVIYAETELAVPDDWCPALPGADPWDIEELVDIPVPGSRIPLGQPVFSMIVAKPDAQRCDLGRIWKRHRERIKSWAVERSDED